MKKTLFAILLITTLIAGAQAQAVTTTAGKLRLYGTAPSGACQAGQVGMLVDGTKYKCNSGTWAADTSAAGTVTTVSVTTANGVSGSVANATTTPAITLTLGAITPTTVNGLTITTSTGTLAVANSKIATISNTLTFTGTDSSSVAFGAGGTVAYLGTANSFTAAQTVTSSSGSGQASVNVTNNASVTGTLTSFGSSFAVTGLPNTVALASTGVLILLPDQSTASGGTSTVRIYAGGYNSSNERVRIDASGNLNMAGGVLGFGSLTAPDIGLARNAAGVLEANSGTAGTYRDIKVRRYQADATITAGGTTGAQTINKGAGCVNAAAASTSLVVTNSLVSTSSIILASIQTADTTTLSAQAVAGSGSFTLTYPAATAETKICFVVFN